MLWVHGLARSTFRRLFVNSVRHELGVRRQTGQCSCCHCMVRCPLGHFCVHLQVPAGSTQRRFSGSVVCDCLCVSLLKQQRRMLAAMLAGTDTQQNLTLVL